MNDPFEYSGRAKVEMFGTTKIVGVMLTKDAIRESLHITFRVSDGNLLWIERGEDEYASNHYEGKVAVKVTREEWISTKPETTSEKESP